MEALEVIKSDTKCTHCGHKSKSNYQVDDNYFCCQGCQILFEVLSEKQDCGTNANTKEFAPKDEVCNTFLGAEINRNQTLPHLDFLDLKKVSKQFVRYEDNQIATVELLIPQINCASCVKLLDNLHLKIKGVRQSIVNFSQKKITLTYFKSETNLKEVIKALTNIGYAPNLDLHQEKADTKQQKNIIYKVGVAGFCFGNIMLLSFPEYLGIDASFQEFQYFFGILSLIISLPVMFFSGFSYLKNALYAISQKKINIDVPIALGMIALFGRSAYEILSHTGAGYLDSLAGLVLFLLVGKWFQQKTYDTLSFTRDYKSYFPIAVNKWNKDNFKPVKIEHIKENDLLQIRCDELIPTDGYLEKGQAIIDYSFVTGESKPTEVKLGDTVYAGGKQLGQQIEVRVTKRVNNSYLTQLWNQAVFQKNDKGLKSIIDAISKYFTIVVIALALATGLFWFYSDESKIWNAITAVLIVACPCALALSMPFVLGNTNRIFGKAGLYLKDSSVVEKMAKINYIVFDKTGTITSKANEKVKYFGEKLALKDLKIIKSMVAQSLHPMSLAINRFLTIQNYNSVVLDEFSSVVGKGIKAMVGGEEFLLVSASFVGTSKPKNSTESTVFLKIGKNVKGYFSVEQSYREGFENMLLNLKKSNIKTMLLSGDNAE